MKGILRIVLLVAVTVAVAAHRPHSNSTAAAQEAPARRVNIPYAGQEALDGEKVQPAIFWFGKVDPTNNYADVRTIYNAANLEVTVHIIDRRLHYDLNPSLEGLTEWDAVTLFLDTTGNTAGAPGSSARQFVAQLNHLQPRAAYQAAYQGDGSGWQLAAIPFQTTTGWRGNGLNDPNDDRGWRVTFSIPFASLGLAQPPPEGASWAMALAVHDRDDAGGLFIPVTTWPETLASQNPATWGQAVFGGPAYPPPTGLPVGTVTIRHGLDGAIVTDAHVGGHSSCGEAYWPHFFDGWGDANYAGYGQVNVQNQWDLADWPCFSKYYVTFPLDAVPDGRSILAATLTMHLFGSAQGPGIAPSFIQVLSVAEAWNEDTLTWNNAPLAKENISGTWVAPIFQSPGWPGLPHHWNVGPAAAEAYRAGQPLRLVLYSADSAYHSGRYFSSSDTGDWNAVARPTLKVTWGVPAGSPGYYFHFVPAILR